MITYLEVVGNQNEKDKSENERERKMIVVKLEKTCRDDERGPCMI